MHRMIRDGMRAAATDESQDDEPVNEPQVVDVIETGRQQPDHPLTKIHERTGRDMAMLERWVAAIERKGQAVLVGPPGAGKSFLAHQLARHLVGGGDGFVQRLALHPASTYEDFVQGYRPTLRKDGTTHWPLTRGRFYLFVEKALQRRGRCVLILEEMQRADVGTLLGELVHLLEARDEPMPLAAGDAPFVLPSNVRIIGTMSSADPRRPATDHVLRRRFAHLRVTPDPETLRRFHAKTGFPVDGLLAVIARADALIRDPDRALGMSYFLRDDLAETIEDVWRFEVEPMLDSLLADRPADAARLRWDAVRHRILG
jgi:5-methylcytosine-specific restriction protein B